MFSNCILFAFYFQGSLLPSPWRGGGGAALFPLSFLLFGVGGEALFPLSFLLFGVGGEALFPLSFLLFGVGGEALFSTFLFEITI